MYTFHIESKFSGKYAEIDNKWLYMRDFNFKYYDTTGKVVFSIFNSTAF